MRALLLILTLALATPLAALADPDTMGIPDTACQTPSEWRLHDYVGSSSGPPLVGLADGSISGCAGGSTWDGDREFAYGGAALVSHSGDGVTWGGVACHGVVGHHPRDGVVSVNDLTGLPVAFDVAVDYWDPASPAPPGEADCGDGVLQPCDPASPLPGPCTPGDFRKSCVASCLVDFPPGIDGAYLVFVNTPERGAAARGHVYL